MTSHIVLMKMVNQFEYNSILTTSKRLLNSD